MEIIKFHTAGQLKKALESVPDDTFIVCQVVDAEGGAWNMWGEFCPKVPGGTIACITFSHPTIKKLPIINS